ncbi:isoprenylcysteine carboxyl methyltransferase family protein [Halobacillus sp. A5]|uniref:isoprenylcysteine carboxyl methyltransferase family protein n=1 Tax=Halobacillus sp. A5 TaxID=2880263 RepID=UPI0020A6A93C|nr:isoprenylcysteine carboxylmethyltransferase family protein [Halobacillus sp. A5]MCP3025902.1 hypothetical protein [Halobacillus sp. A5]
MWLFLFLVSQRLVELVIAWRNKKWMLKRGGKEVEAGHYHLFIWLHALFFTALFAEWYFLKEETLWLAPFLMISFLILQALRIWCIASLGRKWNTRIIVIPGEPLIERGPYQFVKHPNYVIVFFELLIIPLIFQAFVTAVIFPLLHLIVLSVRIPAEERALSGDFE